MPISIRTFEDDGTRNPECLFETGRRDCPHGRRCPDGSCGSMLSKKKRYPEFCKGSRQKRIFPVGGEPGDFAWWFVSEAMVPCRKHAGMTPQYSRQREGGGTGGWRDLPGREKSAGQFPGRTGFGFPFPHSGNFFSFYFHPIRSGNPCKIRLFWNPNPHFPQIIHNWHRCCVLFGQRKKEADQNWHVICYRIAGMWYRQIPDCGLPPIEVGGIRHPPLHGAGS